MSESFLARLQRALIRRMFPREPRPTMLSIEPTNFCNLNCPFCLVGLQNTQGSVAHSELMRPMGRMDMALYRKVIEDAWAFGIRDLQLHFQGEPLLHRALPEMVRIARARGLPVTIFTNGMLMDAPQATALLEAGITGIRFSVDGATPDTYAVNRVGGDFNTVLTNMRRTVELARAGGRPVRILWQFIAMRNNEHEIEAARELAREIGIEFVVKGFAASVPELVPVAPALRRRLILKPCRDIWRALFMYWNGDVVVCCYDQNGENVIGNAGRTTLAEIWSSRAARRLRKRIARAVSDPSQEPAMCRRCLKWGHQPWQTTDGLVHWEPVAEAGEVEEGEA